MSHDSYNRPHQRSTILNFDQDDDDVGHNGDNGVKEALLRESGHLTNSERLLDEQYELAWKTRENLMHQRSAISSMRESLNNITGRFTVVNDLVKRIKIRKRRDTIIVAIVFSICLGLLLYHMLL
uniref:Golgi SNAP receptor complex member 1 n=1 Tax=Aceria tosichella TaxID=561515 RepID=A0A6G1SFS6_9ACAR